jgi:xanthine/CO dehydrogenase XdhC/CoxF family maturation factor
MRDVLDAIQQWQTEGKGVALATVVSAEGSAPRREGAKLAISSEGELMGSVSGGCVESDVLYQALDTIQDGQPRLLRYAITDDMVWEVGLACGGTIEVYVERLAAANEAHASAGQEKGHP